MQYSEDSHIKIHVKSAGVVILDSESRILLVQEKVADAAGLWHIPAGAVEAGEALETAALREAKEETGLAIELVSYLNTYIGQFPSGDLIARHVWLAQPITNAKPSPLFKEEIAACAYVSMPDFIALYQQKKIRMFHTKLMFEEALELKNTLCQT